MIQVPRTMTHVGLDFLSALASQKTNGVFLEVGPLFGSSTNAIDKGRKNDEYVIHTIDTFEAAPWVKKRLGIDLSRSSFDKFTNQIKNLQVHEGFAPDIVRDTWKEEIGFYFDDATHGDPGWTDNFEFFSKFFNEETIICGDDFAGGWPDIVRNVYAHAEEWDVNLYVMGRVWAMARKGDERISEAVNMVYPKLKDTKIVTSHQNKQHTNQAACWSWGLHRVSPIEWFSIDSKNKTIFDGEIVTFNDGSVSQTAGFDSTKIKLTEINQIYISFPNKESIQYCLVNENGKTSNTKAFKSRQIFDIPLGSKIVAIRLSAK